MADIIAEAMQYNINSYREFDCVLWRNTSHKRCLYGCYKENNTILRKQAKKVENTDNKVLTLLENGVTEKDVIASGLIEVTRIGSTGCNARVSY